MTTTVQSPQTGRWMALGALALAVLAVGIDITVLSVALPTLAVALRATNAQLQWFLAAYMLALVALLLPAGVLGDRFGRKRYLLGALALFGAASVACALSTTPLMLIGARTALGIAAAFIIPLPLSSIPVLFGDAERPRAVAVYYTATFVSFPLGPILGGWLLSSFWWGWIFLINVPVVVVSVAAVIRFLPESRSAMPPSLDPVGMLGSGFGLAGVVYGLIESGGAGWSSASTLVPIAAGLVVFGGFVVWELRRSERGPGASLVDVSLFRARRFTWGIILQALATFGMTAVLFGFPQYLQAIAGKNAFGTGVMLLPMVAGLIVGAMVTSKAARNAGPKTTIGLGFVVTAAGLFLGAMTRGGSGIVFAAIWTAAVGMGMGVAMTAAADGILGSLPVDRTGVGSAIMQAVKNLGAPIATAVLGSVYNAVYRGSLDLGGVPAPAADAASRSVFSGIAAAQRLHAPALLQSVRASFVGGFDAMLVVCGVTATLGLVLTLCFMPAARPGRSASPGGSAPTAPTSVERSGTGALQ